MPVRSLNSSVMKWPDKQTVVKALLVWVEIQREIHPDLFAVGYFGSYARGDWSVGSDLDLVILVTNADTRVEERTRSWPTEQLPVPVDLLVYSTAEWQQPINSEAGFSSTLRNEIVWIFHV